MVSQCKLLKVPTIAISEDGVPFSNNIQIVPYLLINLMLNRFVINTFPSWHRNKNEMYLRDQIKNSIVSDQQICRLINPQFAPLFANRAICQPAEWADGHGQEQLDDICHWPPLVTNPVTCQVSFWVTLSKSSFTCSFVQPTRWNWTNETKSKKKRSVQTANDIPIEIDRVGLYLRDRERWVTMTNLRCV